MLWASSEAAGDHHKQTTKQTMRTLSKSKLITFRQCPKRLWLEIHKPELREDSGATTASFAVGHKVGDIARELYDPKRAGVVFELQQEGFDAVFARTQTFLGGTRPMFEAGFSAAGALAFADVMLPVRRRGQRSWRMIEVKSSSKLKDYHRDDVAIQAFVARSAGVQLASVSLAHIDTSWVYPGGGDYEGLLVEHDLTEDAFARGGEVSDWIAEAQAVASRSRAPKVATGRQCVEPFACGFIDHCESGKPQAEYPVAWLPNIRRTVLKDAIDNGAADLRDVPDELLDEQQLKVKRHTLSGRTFFDRKGAQADLAGHKLPAYFLDFETVLLPVPRWKGTWPYQQVPFQFSVHRLSRTGQLTHQAFLDLSGRDPRRACAEALIDACGKTGPIFAYNADFEKLRIAELAAQFPRLKASLQAIRDRIVDLLPIARQRFYHPSQQGKWSIKNVLPAIAPDLRYDELDGIQNGGMAMQAYQEAIAPDTDAVRKAEIEKQLLTYCELDTFAMVRLWQFFAGRNDLKFEHDKTS
jgi:hypothetical protein